MHKRFDNRLCTAPVRLRSVFPFLNDDDNIEYTERVLKGQAKIKIAKYDPQAWCNAAGIIEKLDGQLSIQDCIWIIWNDPVINHIGDIRI